MKNFFNCLGHFKKEGQACLTFDSELYLPPQVECTVPREYDESVMRFFAGENVRVENISTTSAFKYDAYVIDDGVFSAREFQHGIDAGLRKIGVNAETRVRCERPGNYSVSIVVV